MKRLFWLSVAAVTPVLLLVLGTMCCSTYQGMFAMPMAMGYHQPLPLEGRPAFNTETYDRIDESPFLAAAENPLSTFAVDVDTASYSNVRRFLREGQRPPADAVRIEELINYFSYDYPEPSGEHPVSVTAEVADCPWAEGHRLVRIGLKARGLEDRRLPPRNLVFLVDVSGSMMPPNKLPLLKSALRLLVDQLNETDRLALVVYAGSSGLVLPPTPGDRKAEILEAQGRLEAGGSANGADGIRLAYRTAREHFNPQGVNRVILATDGDFNVGVTSQGELLRLIERERESGIFLTVLGVGMGNLKDSTLEKLADRGNGHYAYIDDLAEARKVLVNEAGSTLVTVAREVKIQVEFNPARVQAYRLIGYEDRLLRAEEFNDDGKDAGEMGAGHTVTALYEVVPVWSPSAAGTVDPLRYRRQRRLTPEAASGGLAMVKVRYQPPEGGQSRLLSLEVTDRPADMRQASADMRHAAAVAVFGMLLRGSEHRGRADWRLVRERAESTRGRDPHGYRAEFIALVNEAERVLARE